MKHLFIVFALFISLAHADEVDKIVGDKFVEYNGVCRVDKLGKLVFDDNKTNRQERCVVTYEEGNDQERWVAMFSNNQPNRIIKFNLKTMNQVVVWSRMNT